MGSFPEMAKVAVMKIETWWYPHLKTVSSEWKIMPSSSVTFVIAFWSNSRD